jgi:hypothetical protein
LIGLEYSGSELANFNANFWASDAFAALGLAGVPLATGAMCAVFYLINKISRGFSPRFVALWLTGFWLAVLNVPLSTAVLSGGGALTMLLLWSSRTAVRGQHKYKCNEQTLTRADAVPATDPAFRT